MKVISIVPAYNEEGKIGITVARTKPFVDVVLVVDDCSSDNTSKEAESKGATVIKHDENRGVGAAIRTGIDYTIKKKYDVVVVLGGDNQDDPEEIPKFIEKINNGYDFVQGSRYINEKSYDYPLFRKLTTKAYSLFFRTVSGINVTDASNGFRAFRVDIIKDMDIWRGNLNGYELEPYILLQSAKNYKYTEIAVEKHYHKDKGYTKMKPFVDWFRITMPILNEFLNKNDIQECKDWKGD